MHVMREFFPSGLSNDALILMNSLVDWGAMNNRHRLFAFVVLLVCATLLVAFWTTETYQALIIAVTLIVMLWLTKAIWLPDGYGRSKVAMMSLAVVMSTAALVVGARQWFEPLVLGFLQKTLGARFTPVEGVLDDDGTVSAMVLAFVLLAVFAVNYALRDKSTMQAHPVPLDTEFPEKGYRQQLKQFCDVLHHHLRVLNTETNWSDAFFTPLEAQVENTTGNRTTRRITNLLGAIKSDRSSRLFLVLGDPGSGKSVALRTLAMELLGDVERSGRVPVYVNLREWSASQSWTEENPPTVEHLYAFVLDSLKERSDVFGLEFLTEYYHKMLHHGRFFLLLDSFDEIPAVLDVGESSWLIERLSNVIATFFAATGTARGVVSSRLYRRPKFSLSHTATLEIRPFSELQIAEALQRSLAFPKATLKKLFTERSELIPIARNPFTAALIRTYASQNNGELPGHQVQLYEAHLRSRLKAANERLQKQNLTADEVVAGCENIAWLMFVSPDFGLEASVAHLESSIPSTRVREVAKLLEYARLGRLGETDAETFSFVHRRFAEYFVAMHLIRNPEAVHPSAIPLDSRWRDALVLYCEVAPQREAEKIAHFCVQEIGAYGEASIESAEFLRVVHAIRFLSDAFRTRPECLVNDQFGLAEHIQKQVSSPANPILAKIAVEAVGLLRPEQMERTIVRAFALENPWISETALRACRHLPRISQELEQRIRSYVASLAFGEFLARRRELLFSLSLSDAFKPLHTYCLRRSADHQFLLGILLMVALVFPLLFIMFVGMFLMLMLGVVSDDAGDSKGGRGRYIMVNISAERYLVFARIVTVLWLVSVFISALISSTADRANSSFPRQVFDSPVGHMLSASVLLVLGVIAIIGLTPLYLFDRMGSLKRFIRGFVEVKYYLLAVVAIAMIVIAAPESVQIIALGLLLVLSSITALAVGWSVVSGLYVHVRKTLKDRRLFRQMLLRPIFDRNQIQADLAGLQSASYRLRYVRHLQRTAVVPTGSWSPSGEVFGRNDPAAILLSQLEEKWLGLDR